ncbi:transporter [Roseibium aquae]|uniref:Transporter n=1 Tax=Roseibium aquae TaxID=1323746 RepID=A0A916TMQ6_9HYPH|nr:AEC family transporter [Roseibium aquae]GGB58848.1 transporter [Roseibium aquae]
MLTTFNALLPVILVIASGHVIARTGLIGPDQWRGIERLAYYLLFPAVLFQIIAKLDFATLPTAALSATLVCAILTLSVLVLAFRPVLQRVWGIPGYRFTSIFQGTVRWNAFVALAIADSLLGEQGVAIIAVGMAVMIPLLNVLSILVLSRYAHAEPPTLAKTLKDLGTNPFILSIAAGLAVNAAGLPIPGPLDDTLTIIGSAALPVGIMCVGAGLDLASLRRPGPALTSGTFIRLLVMPLVGAFYASVFGITGPALTAVIISLAVPAASNSYLMAKLMGGDAKLMAEILTLQTLVAVGTIPLMVYFLGGG